MTFYLCCKFVFLFMCMLICASGQTVQDAKDLRTQLLTTDAYDYTVRPIANQSDFITVNVSYTLLTVNALDEVQEVLKTTGFLSVLWTDSELQWTPSSYGGLSSTFFPQNEVWKPDIALKNSNSDYKPLGTAELNVEVSSDGTVEWYPFQVFTSTCSIDIRYYPFDVQICQLKFVAWSYGNDEVYLQSSGGISLNQYEANPSWDILDTSSSQEVYGEEQAIAFTIKFKRKPLYVLLTILFPILMLSILNLFVFVLPSEGGEKAGYAVTVFLAFSVFLTIVEATMPVNSTSVAIFSVYLILMTVQSTVITMLALAMVRCSGFNVEVIAVPNWIIKLASIGKFKPCRKKKTWPINVIEVSADELETHKKVDLNKKRETEPEKKYTWKHVINGLDSFCLVFFTFHTVLVTILCLALSAGLAGAE